MKYRVTKKILDGHLEDMTIKEDTNVDYILGKTYTEAITGTHYEIIGMYVYAE